MRTIAERRQTARTSNPNDYDRQRIREMRQERCGMCDGVFPSSVMTTEDGRRRCPGCIEVRGAEELERLRGIAQAWIAEDVVKGQEYPLRRPVMDSPTGSITGMTRADGSNVSQTSPLALRKGGVAVALTLTGTGFSSSDTFVYPTVIADSSPPTLTGTSRWVLSLIAAVGAYPGGDYFHFTFNGTTWRGLFSIR